MPFIPDAIRMPWNRRPDKAAPNTSMLYPKSDNAWYTRGPAGTETFVGGDDTGWTDLPLINNWLQYDTANFRAQYRRKNGVVYVKGLVKKTVGLVTEPVCTLPVGFRPASIHIFATTTSAATSPAQTYVRTTGSVEFGANGSGTWTSLDGLTFIADL